MLHTSLHSNQVDKKVDNKSRSSDSPHNNSKIVPIRISEDHSPIVSEKTPTKKDSPIVSEHNRSIKPNTQPATSSPAAASQTKHFKPISPSSPKSHRPLSSAVQPDNPADDPVDIPLPGLDEIGGEVEPDVSNDRLRERDNKAMLRHRLTGHSTYNPNCVHCVSSKGVTRHPRNKTSTEPQLQADFGFVDNQKYLVLWESVSKARAFIHVRSNIDITITEVRNWVKMIGLYSTSSTSRCYLKCDAEPSLSALLAKCGIAVIEKSAPQSPETTGGAERSVRYLKESIACLKSDYLENGLSLEINRDSASFIGRYIAMAYNGYHAVDGSKMTPLELVVGQTRQPVQSTMLGALCYAEVPESVVVPAASRFTPACFLGPEWIKVTTCCSSHWTTR